MEFGYWMLCIMVIETWGSVHFNDIFMEKSGVVGRRIFSVKNPVVEKERVVDNAVLVSEGRRHGTGLANVKV